MVFGAALEAAALLVTGVADLLTGFADLFVGAALAAGLVDGVDFLVGLGNGVALVGAAFALAADFVLVAAGAGFLEAGFFAGTFAFVAMVKDSDCVCGGCAQQPKPSTHLNLC